MQSVTTASEKLLHLPEGELLRVKEVAQRFEIGRSTAALAKAADDFRQPHSAYPSSRSSDERAA